MSKRPKPTLVYIAGPMTGYKDNNRPAFREAAAQLRQMGYSCTSPEELDDGMPVSNPPSWEKYMRRDLHFVIQADMGVLLTGWRASPGAKLEAAVMNALGTPLFEMIGADLRRLDPTVAPQIH